MSKLAEYESEELTPKEIVDTAIKEHGIKKLYVLFSGGKDSVCVLHYIATNYPDQFAGAVFTNTGLGSTATRKFVIDYCKQMGWKLWLTWNGTGADGIQDRKRFSELVLEHGFATAGSHRIWMGYLKFHTWYYFGKWRRNCGEKFAFISGVRRKESRQRSKVKKYSKTPVDVNATMVFIKPFLYKNGVQLWDYFLENALKKTPVYEWLNRSGECYCGAFTEDWDLKLLEKYDPLAFSTIRYYEKLIQEKGTKEAKKNGVWGSKTHSKIKTRTTEDVIHQTSLDGFEVEVNEDYCGESCMVYDGDDDGSDEPEKFSEL